MVIMAAGQGRPYFEWLLRSKGSPDASHKGAKQRGRSPGVAAPPDAGRDRQGRQGHRGCGGGDRRREVVLLAAHEFNRREIADRLSVSVRTVDNHLQRVHIKLGIGGRGELADRV